MHFRKNKNKFRRSRARWKIKLDSRKNRVGKRGPRAVVVVKWLVRSPSSPMIRVRISLMPTVISVKIVFVRRENKQKEADVDLFLSKILKTLFVIFAATPFRIN